MSSLGQVEQHQQYHFKIMSELLVQARLLNIDVEGFVGFLGAQVQAMLACPPNYSKFGVKKRAWIMRGFFPGTGLFFKLTIGTEDSGSGNKYSYFVKASPLRVNHFIKGVNREASVVVNSDKLNEDIVNRMENEFFGADHELKNLLEEQIKLPRCMSPKGLQIFRFDVSLTDKGKT